MKQTIRLTESELKKMIKSVIRENTEFVDANGIPTWVRPFIGNPSKPREIPDNVSDLWPNPPKRRNKRTQMKSDWEDIDAAYEPDPSYVQDLEDLTRYERLGVSDDGARYQGSDIHKDLYDMADAERRGELEEAVTRAIRKYLK